MNVLHIKCETIPHMWLYINKIKNQQKYSKF